MRLIDADKLQKAIPAEEDSITGMGMTYDEMEAYNDGIDEQWKKIVNAPTIEPQRPKGEWVPVEDDIPYGLLVECSKCGHRIIINDALEHNYCSECGADMR